MVLSLAFIFLYIRLKKSIYRRNEMKETVHTHIKKCSHDISIYLSYLHITKVHFYLFLHIFFLSPTLLVNSHVWNRNEKNGFIHTYCQICCFLLQFYTKIINIIRDRKFMTWTHLEVDLCTMKKIALNLENVISNWD